jgi:hypothetical protein
VCRWGLTLLLVLAGVSGVAGQVTDEQRLKAAFVSKFPDFVEWPDEAWDGEDAVGLCVVRASAVVGPLRTLVDGRSLGGRPYAVREIGPDDDPDHCHVLFVPAGTSYATDLLDRIGTRPVLTVGEGPDFARAGGIITLQKIDRRIRFEVNATAATQARLRLSSQLLRMALQVRGGRS